jgi:hypothetical protein
MSQNTIDLARLPLVCLNGTMPKRSSKKKPSPDPVTSAFDTLSRIIEQTEGGAPPPPKNPAAVALGRLGGLKGGKARADALSAKRRRDIARLAAKKRWRSK